MTQGALLFNLAGIFSNSSILFPLAFGILVMGLLGIVFVKSNQFSHLALVMAPLPILGIALGSFMLDGAFGYLPPESSILVYGTIISGIGIIINLLVARIHHRLF